MTTHAQHAIGSGFGPRSTAQEVLRGIGLGGRLALVTGGYSGLGLETTRALTDAGAHVVVPARRRTAAQEAVAAAGIEGVEIEELDLSDLESVRGFAERFLASGRGIDLMINNAGIMACPETRVGPEGWEAQFATNHLGHFALVNRLWPALVPGARVISVSSNGHQLSDIRFGDVQFERGYDKWQAYGQAKTANALFAVQLDAYGRESDVRAFSLHPGVIATRLSRHIPLAEMIAAGWVDERGTPDTSALKSPQQGAATQLWAATSPQLTGMGGLYCEDCDVAELAAEGPGAGGGNTDGASASASASQGEGTSEGEGNDENELDTLGSGVRAYATDPGRAARLWELSARLTGVDAFAGSRKAAG